MTTALWCLMIAALLPIVCTGIAKWGFKGFDNNRPREWLARQDGWRARMPSHDSAVVQRVWPLSRQRPRGVTCTIGTKRVDAIAIASPSCPGNRATSRGASSAVERGDSWMIGLGLSISLFVISA